MLHETAAGSIAIAGDSKRFLERAAKTQAALLEAMEERQVSGDGVTRPLPSPFAVIATQNLFIVKGTGKNYTAIKRPVTFRPLSTDEGSPWQDIQGRYNPNGLESDGRDV